MELKHFFLLDWCPYGTTRADLENLLSIRKLDHTARKQLLDSVEQCTGHRPLNLVFAARADGMLIFSFDVPTTYRRYDVRDAAHALSFQLKELIFEHTHHHHTKQKRGIGIHPPVAFHCDQFAGATKQNDGTTEREIKSAIEVLLKCNSDLYNLRPVSWDGQIDKSGRAVLLLDKFIARRYDHCIDDISSNIKQLKSDRFMRSFKLILAFLSINISLILIYKYIISDIVEIKQVIIFLIISTFLTILLWLYMNYRNNYRYNIHMLNSYIGFFERAGDFSEVANSLCMHDANSRSSESGYKNLIGSLCVIKEDIQRKISAEESVFTGALTILGLALALIALVEF